MDTNGSSSQLPKPRIRLHRFLFYFITLAALILIYWKFSEVKLIEDAFARSNLFWIIGVVAIQIASYYFTALNFRDVLRVKDTEVGIKELFPVTFVIQFLNQALPSAGFSGQAFFIQYLRKFGLSIAEGIGRALLELATLYMAFGAFFIVSSVLMFRGDILDKHPEGRFLIYGFAFCAIIAVSLFFMLQKKGRGKIAHWLISKLHDYFEQRDKKKIKNGEASNGSNHTSHVLMIYEQFKSTFNISVLKKHKKAFWLAFLWQAMVLFANVLTLYFLSYAIGSRIDFFVAFIAFTLTKFLSMISFIPGALGVFEGGMTLILVSFGIPANPAFAMTMLLRAFSFWFPMPVGWILYRWYIHKRELEHPYEDLPSANPGN